MTTCSKATWHQESSFPQRLNDAEVMTIAPGSSPGQALVAAACFQGRHDPARFMLAEHGYIPGKISKSRFNRRLHRLKDTLATVFDLLGQLWKTLDTEGVYVIDSFPVAVCDNIRIRRAKLYRHETYRGYQASKRRYFYGLKIHLVVTSAGQPVECVLTPGSVSDVQVLKGYAYDLPCGSVVYADKAYNDYEIEDPRSSRGQALLAEVERIHLLPVRKKNSRRPLSASARYLQAYYRKRVETAGSQLMGLFPKSLHAVRAAGFELKVALFVLAYSFDCYFKLVGTL